MRRKLEELNKALTRGSRTQLSLPREATPRNAVQADEEPTIPVVTQQHRTLSPEAVINGLQRFQERKIIESQEEEISALKQRMKEVRLNLQR